MQKWITTIVAAIVGGTAGAISGIFGAAIGSCALSGMIAGGLVGFFESQLPRSPMAALYAVESWPVAGLVGGLVGAFQADLGVGGYLVCGFGGIWLGFYLPRYILACIDRLSNVE